MRYEQHAQVQSLFRRPRSRLVCNYPGLRLWILVQRRTRRIDGELHSQVVWGLKGRSWGILGIWLRGRIEWCGRLPLRWVWTVERDVGDGGRAGCNTWIGYEQEEVSGISEGKVWPLQRRIEVFAEPIRSLDLFLLGRKICLAITHIPTIICSLLYVPPNQ